MRKSGIRRVAGAGGRPTVHAGIVSATGIQIAEDVVISAPHNHPASSPHCRVNRSCGRRVGHASGCPSIRVGIVSPPCVKILRPIDIRSTPGNHFTAGPDRSMLVSGIGRIYGIGSCPIIRTWVVSAAGIEDSRVISATPDDHFGAGPH
jgi:hypothetical protein